MRKLRFMVFVRAPVCNTGPTIANLNSKNRISTNHEALLLPLPSYVWPNRMSAHYQRAPSSQTVQRVRL